MKIINFLKALVCITFGMLNLVFWGCLVLILAFFKIIIPFEKPRDILSKILIELGNGWIKGNNLNMSLTQNIQWKVEGLEDLKLDEWYVVISNHQSWLDILVLQKIFLGKIPFLKFFLKQELIWVPILGPCCGPWIFPL